MTGDKFDTLSFIMKFEGEPMDYDEVVEGFQHMINSGVVWQLQGSYGRTAQRLIDDGVCHPATRN